MSAASAAVCAGVSRASGISVGQLLRPVFAAALLLSVLTFLFMDQLLPASNLRLKALVIDIGRKKPTFDLQEQAINEIPPSLYYLRAGRIDPSSGRLRDVTIYDMSGQQSRRVIYADSGRMAFEEGQIDLTAMVDYLDEFANTTAGDPPLPVAYDQRSVGVSFPAAAPAT